MKIIDWIISIFNKYVKLFKELISQAIPLISQILIGKLKVIALEIVSELAQTDLSDAEKRQQAFERIKAYAIANGIQAKDSIINLVIELAVQLYKESNE